ncbi:MULTISPECIES: Ltp family lipoprotein [Nocardioides]|nr:Ltp family lipoprotein [Nocardioides sp. CGMCC 1.13656]
MNGQTTQYKPGDIANGHVLTEAGQWLPVAGPTAPAEPKAKKPIYKRWWAIALAAIIVIGGISSATGGSDEPTKAKDDTVAAAVEHPKDEAPAEGKAEAVPEPKPESEPEMTASQENAIKSAESYLDMSGFSRQGLIDQLSSQYGDDYPRADAIFAVNHLDVDWNAEAVESAESYLDMSGFSRQGLIDQLSSQYGDQYTVAQATYAANKVGL